MKKAAHNASNANNQRYRMPNTMFLTTFLAGFVFVIVGFVMLKYPAKRINYWYGYRTPSATKNQARWDFAQVYSTKELIKIGAMLLLISGVAFIVNLRDTIPIIAGALIVFVSAMVMLIRVEQAIKNRFGS